ncbi:MAG: copper amine oxidase N-terminal domain-containing protein [Tissierellia bacterium]|nr:copper amine oxidase N-terminal domain-containing protein [Tissierellia bacterium]
MMYKKGVSILLAVLMMGLCFTQIVVAEEGQEQDILIFVQGKEMRDLNYVVEKERILVPLRALSEGFGYEVQWNQEDQSIDIEKGEDAIHMELSKVEFIANGKEKLMDIPPFVKDERTYVPLRFVAEAFGMEVTWDGENKTVIIGAYGETKDYEGELVTFTLGEHSFTLSMTAEMKEAIQWEEKEDRIDFYDALTKEKATDGASGHLYTLMLEKTPRHPVPLIVLDYVEDTYLLALAESGVEWSLALEDSEEAYTKSKALLEQCFKSYTPAIH